MDFMLNKARSALQSVSNFQSAFDVKSLFGSSNLDDREAPETSSSSSPPPAQMAEGLSVGSVLCEAPLDSDDDDSEDEDSEEFRRPMETSELCAQLGECAPLALTLTHGSYHNLRKLARAIRSGVYVLMITGAGVSVASGIKTYRTGADGVWNNFLLEVCFSLFSLSLSLSLSLYLCLRLLMFSLSSTPLLCLLFVRVFFLVVLVVFSGEQRRSFWKILLLGGQIFGSVLMITIHLQRRNLVQLIMPLQAS